MKNSRPLILSRPLVITGLIIAFILAAGTATISGVATQEVSGAGKRVIQTQGTLLEISQLLSSIIDTETGQRGYILTGLESYLEPYTRASAVLDDQLAALNERFKNSPAQLATLNRISDLVAAKNDEMKRTIELRRNSEVGPALHLLDSGKGLNTMNALRESVRELEQRELTDLAQRSSAAAGRANFFQFTSVSMLLIAGSLTTVFAWVLIRRMHELETMITVCAWTKRVKFNGAWVSFEEYLHTRFNLQFTHGISEEAARKLKMEELELLQADRLKYSAKNASASAKQSPRIEGETRPGPLDGSSGSPFSNPA